jgi:hypothetical protein
MTVRTTSNDGKLKDTPRPEDFLLGSPESRAAARVEAEQRERPDSTIVVWCTGLPWPSGQAVVIPPDSLARYQMPDGSIVEVIRRHWENDNRRGVTVFVTQTWPDGSIYYGEDRVKSLEELERTGCLVRDQDANFRKNRNDARTLHSSN